MPYSNFLILIPKKTSLARRASDGLESTGRIAKSTSLGLSDTMHAVINK